MTSHLAMTHDAGLVEFFLLNLADHEDSVSLIGMGKIILKKGKMKGRK